MENFYNSKIILVAGGGGGGFTTGGSVVKSQPAHAGLTPDSGRSHRLLSY